MLLAGSLDPDVYRFERTHRVAHPGRGPVRGVVVAEPHATLDVAGVVGRIAVSKRCQGPLLSEPVKCVARFPSRAPIVGCPYNAFGLVAM